MKAGNCDKFHPKLCNGSVKTKSCYKKDCKLTHLKGTRRVENRNEKPANPGSDFLEKSPQFAALSNKLNKQIGIFRIGC